MRIIYHCYGGSHSSVTAASIHLGYLPDDRIPSYHDFMELPFYEKQDNSDHGHLRLMGIDDFGNEIFIVGRRNQAKSFKLAISGIARIFGITEKDLYLADTMPYVNWKMMLGGFLSRRWNWIRIGRPLVIKGTQASFLDLANLVQSIKMQVASNEKLRS